MVILARHSKWLKAALFACATMCMLHTQASAEDKPLQLYEQKIKAGLVYNFLKYTTWPQAQGRLEICLLGDDPFDGFLSPLQGRTAQQSVIAIAHVSTIAETGSCSVIVIGRDREAQLAQIFDYLQGKPVLTISDIGDFARAGGMVEMAKENEKIDLYINKDAIAHAGLSIGDRMARLAKNVSG